jgi:hypothetical protein
MASVEVEAKAAAGGVAMIGDYYTYTVGSFEQLALTLPTVSRSTDLMASLISDLSMKHYTRQWTGERYEEIYLPNEPWMEQLDPSVPQQFVLANLFRDLFFYGRAFLWVSSRRADDNRPATFQWLPASNIATPSQNGPQYFGMPDQIEFNGVQVDPANVITFLSPSVGLVWTGSRTVSIALHLDQFADRISPAARRRNHVRRRIDRSCASVGGASERRLDRWGAQRLRRICGIQERSGRSERGATAVPSARNGAFVFRSRVSCERTRPRLEHDVSERATGTAGLVAFRRGAIRQSDHGAFVNE